MTEETLNKLSDDEKKTILELIGDNKKQTAKKMSDSVKKILQYLGYILSGIGAVSYLITIIVLVNGVDSVDFILRGKDGWFFGIGLVFGLWIRTGFYIQGIAYAKDENKEIMKEYHDLRVKDKPERWRGSFGFKMTISVILNLIMQVGLFLITTFGFIYLAGFEGIKNPVYIWSALSSLIMFAGFGLISLVSTYEKYNELKIPVIKERLRLLKIEKEEDSKDTAADSVDLVIDNKTEINILSGITSQGGHN